MNTIISHGSQHRLGAPFRVAQSSVQNPSASLLDVFLLRLSARSLAQRGQHTAITCGMLIPTMPSASFSLTEIVHFPDCRYPPNGGEPSRVGGALDPAALEPSRTWNGHPARQWTAAVSG